MIKGKKIFSVLALFILAVVTVVTANAWEGTGQNCVGSLPAMQFRVEVDDTDLTSVQEDSSVNKLSLDRANEFEVRVTFVSCVNTSNMEVSAFISGYEHNDKNRMSDTTHVFDADSGVAYIKKLTLNLPSDVEEDYYLLRVIVSDRNGQEVIANYKIQVDSARHKVVIDDVVFSPGTTVVSGRALLATVRVENQGQKDEDSVKVKVSIPALGLSASDFIDTIEADESESSEELYLRVPNCANAGDYAAKVCIEYDDGYEKECKDYMISVVQDEVCKAAVVEDKQQEVKVVVVQQPPVTDNEETSEATEEKSDVASKSGSFDTIKKGLEIGLVILVVLLVILGLIIGFSKLKGKDEDEEKEDKSYY